MSNQNTYAILAMCAIVITCYALRNSEAHYLPDLLGLALALAAPRQSYAIGAVIILAIIRHSPLGMGLAESVPRWLLVIVLPGAYKMSISEAESTEAEDAFQSRILESESNEKYIEIPQPVAEIDEDKVCLIENRLLAKLIIAGALGLTEAIQIGAGAKSGKKYSRRSNQVKLEIDRQRNHYPAGSTQKRFE